MVRISLVTDNNPRGFANSISHYIGMFLYARLVIDYLATNIFYNGNEIKASVNQLPRKLREL